MTSHGDHDQQPGVSGAPDPETLAITAGRSGDDGALAPPVWSSSTFESPSVAAAAADALSPLAQRFYSRNNNPSVAALESAVAELEGAEAARAFASGMGALFAVVFGLCSPGDHVVAQHQLYGGTAMLLGSVCPRFGIEVTFVDATEPGAFAAAVRPGKTMVVLAETPANPGLEIVDLDALGAIAGPTTVVDSTFATPLGQRPLDYGVDLVVHSVTKGLAGHNDATLGMVAGPRDVIEWLWSFAVLHGANASPYDAVNALRGLRTLGVRLERQSATASTLAAVLEDHDGTTRVRHPSLASHPQYDLARRQMRHPGGMVTFDVVPAAGASDDPGATAVAFIEALSLARIATSLGGPETLATHPVSTTHAHLDDDGRRRLGISPATVRLSVGLEHPDDVLADVLAALSLARA